MRIVLSAFIVLIMDLLEGGDRLLKGIL